MKIQIQIMWFILKLLVKYSRGVLGLRHLWRNPYKSSALKLDLQNIQSPATSSLIMSHHQIMIQVSVLHIPRYSFDQNLAIMSDSISITTLI